MRLPEFVTAEHSRPATPYLPDYPILVDSVTICDPKDGPRFHILIERFIAENDLLLKKRKEKDLKRLQISYLELNFEVKNKYPGSNPHPIRHGAKMYH